MFKDIRTRKLGRSVQDVSKSSVLTSLGSTKLPPIQLSVKSKLRRRMPNFSYKTNLNNLSTPLMLKIRARSNSGCGRGIDLKHFNSPS